MILFFLSLLSARLLVGVYKSISAWNQITLFCYKERERERDVRRRCLVVVGGVTFVVCVIIQ